MTLLKPRKSMKSVACFPVKIVGEVELLYGYNKSVLHAISKAVCLIQSNSLHRIFEVNNGQDESI